MQTIEYRTIDRRGWPCGPWDREPDKIQWRDESTGLPCLAKRNGGGNWCGYVGVPDGHPAFGLDYSGFLRDGETLTPVGELIQNTEVHGGLTYADSCQSGADESTGICHKPDDGEPDHVWWFGFDCAHGGDRGPTDHNDYGRRDRQYRTLEYVKENCRSLARQLKAMSQQTTSPIGA